MRCARRVCRAYADEPGRLPCTHSRLAHLDAPHHAAEEPVYSTVHTTKRRAAAKRSKEENRAAAAAYDFSDSEDDVDVSDHGTTGVGECTRALHWSAHPLCLVYRRIAACIPAYRLLHTDARAVTVRICVQTQHLAAAWRTCMHSLPLCLSRCTASCRCGSTHQQQAEAASCCCSHQAAGIFPVC